MSGIKKKIEQSGYAIQIVEKRPFYLAEMFNEAAQEIGENLLLGNRDFDAVNDIVDILNKYQIPVSAKFSDLRGFPYIPLWPAVQEYCHRNMNRVSELGEGIKEVCTDLSHLMEPPPEQETTFKDFYTTPLVLILFAEMYEKQANQLKKFCLSASKNLSNASRDDGYSWCHPLRH